MATIRISMLLLTFVGLTFGEEASVNRSVGLLLAGVADGKIVTVQYDGSTLREVEQVPFPATLRDEITILSDHLLMVLQNGTLTILDLRQPQARTVLPFQDVTKLVSTDRKDKVVFVQGSSLWVYDFDHQTSTRSDLTGMRLALDHWYRTNRGETKSATSSLGHFDLAYDSRYGRLFISNNLDVRTFVWGMTEELLDELGTGKWVQILEGTTSNSVYVADRVGLIRYISSDSVVRDSYLVRVPQVLSFKVIREDVVVVNGSEKTLKGVLTNRYLLCSKGAMVPLSLDFSLKDARPYNLP